MRLVRVTSVLISMLGPLACGDDVSVDPEPTGGSTSSSTTAAPSSTTGMSTTATSTTATSTSAGTSTTTETTTGDATDGTTSSAGTTGDGTGSTGGTGTAGGSTGTTGAEAIVDVLPNANQTFCTYVVETTWTEDPLCETATYSVADPDAPFGQEGHYPDVHPDLSFSGPQTNSGFESDYITVDEVTGLTWKTCLEGLSGVDCQTGDHVYDGLGTAEAACEALNEGDGYAGITTWRIPTALELVLLWDSEGMPLDETHFPNPTPDGFSQIWSATPDPNDASNQSYSVNLAQSLGTSVTDNSESNRLVRCVSGTSADYGTFEDNGDGTVSQSNTGLLWRQCKLGLSGSGCATGTTSAFDWDAALTACEELDFAGRTDWRLPTSKELLSLLDLSTSSYVDPAFPNAGTSGLASSTSNPFAVGGFQGVRLTDGTMGASSSKSNNRAAFCVTEQLP